MNRPIKQHYISKAYLKLFSFNGKQLLVYDKKKNEWRKNNIRDIACENNFQTLAYLENPYFLEEAIAERMEEPGIKVIREIIATKKLPSNLQEFSPLL